MTELVLPWVIGAFAIAILLSLSRLLRGPSAPDRAAVKGWCGWRESNPPLKLGKLAFYR